MTNYGAKMLFIIGTIVCTAIFLWLTLDTLSQVHTRTKEDQLTAQVVAGKKTWQKYNCNDCHTILGIGGYYAPDVTKVASYRNSDWLCRFLKDPEAVWPAARKMPNFHLTDIEIENLIVFFQWVNGIDTNNWPPQPMGGTTPAVSTASTGTMIEARPNEVATTEGLQLFRARCSSCHTINGFGGTVGPELTHIASKRNKEFLEQWLADPTKMKPGTMMPNPNLNKEQIETVVNYLDTLK